MAKIVPGHVRVTGASVNYDLCMGPSGGVTLMIALILTKQTGSDKTSAVPHQRIVSTYRRLAALLATQSPMSVRPAIVHRHETYARVHRGRTVRHQDVARVHRI
jgi:hypothetical protein